MADKNFKVKSGLNIPITSAAILTTDVDGNISSTATLPVANGGTGQTTATNAINALLPTQSGSTVNYALESDGTNVSWQKLYNQTIQNNGTTVMPRGILNIVGGNFTDNSGTDTTTLTLGSSISTKTADYTLVSSDVNKIIEFNSSSDLNLTLPTYSSAAFLYGSSFSIANRGTGKVNVLTQSGTDPLSSFTTAGISSTVYSTFYANNVYFAQSSNAYQRSVDGVTWITISGISATGANFTNQRIAYGNGLFVLTASTGIFTSSDAVTWTQRLISSQTYSIKYANSKFFVGGSNGVMFTSTDGLSWTSLGQVATLNTTTVRSIEYLGSNTWYASTSSSSNSLKSTDNGATWSSISAPTASLAIAYDGTTLVGSVAGNSTSSYYVSSNGGSSWTTKSFGLTVYSSAPYYDGSKIYFAYSNTSAPQTLRLSFLDPTSALSVQSTLSVGNFGIYSISAKASGGYLLLNSSGTSHTAGFAQTSYISENNGSYIPAGGRAEIYNYNQNQFFVSGDLGNASSLSSNITLVSGNKYFVDTTSARTLTLPASPSIGDEIVIYDASNSALTNNITVDSNSNKLQGSVQDLIIDSNAAVAYLAYTGSTYGWAVN